MYKVMVKVVTYMQLSITTDYAIRITLYLLQHKQIVRSSELSEKLDISKTYVLKVTKKLEKVGLVKSYQGASGGITILKNADQITLWDVINATENTTMINKSLAETSSNISNPSVTCPVRKVYIFLQKVVEERLQSIRFSDLLDDTDNALEKELEIDKFGKGMQ